MLYDNYLTGVERKYVAAIDVIWMHLSDQYITKKKRKSSKMLVQRKQSFVKDFMIMSGVSYNGKLNIKNVENMSFNMN